MSEAIEMASNTKVPYQRLIHEDGFGFYDEEYETRDHHRHQKVLVRSRSNWYRRFRKVPIRRRFKVKIPSLRRILRRKAKLVSAVRVSIGRVVKRLKESQSHLNDLFAGNYLFLQVNPASFKSCVDKGHGFPSAYSLPRVA